MVNVSRAPRLAYDLPLLLTKEGGEEAFRKIPLSRAAPLPAPSSRGKGNQSSRSYQSSEDHSYDLFLRFSSIPVIRRASPFTRNHRGAQRTFRRATFHEE